MDADTIRLQSQYKGLRVCVDKGEMDYEVSKGRTPRVKRQPSFISFKHGVAFVEKAPSKDPAVASYETLGARDRKAALLAIKSLNGYAVDFTVVESNEIPSAGRAAAGAAV